MIIPDMLLYFYLLVFWKSDLIKKKNNKAIQLRRTVYNCIGRLLMSNVKFHTAIRKEDDIWYLYIWKEVLNEES